MNKTEVEQLAILTQDISYIKKENEKQNKNIESLSNKFESCIGELKVQLNDFGNTLTKDISKKADRIEVEALDKKFTEKIEQVLTWLIVVLIGVVGALFGYIFLK